jgi:methionyl-tRNA formyltransferase
VLLFCGERSPWGRAHLEPLLAHEHVELVGVALPTDERWTAFRRALLGTDPPERTVRHRIVDAVVGAARRLRGERPPADPTPPFVARIRERGVPVLRHTDANSVEALEDYRGRDPDLVLAAAYPQIFGPAFLEALKPAYNAHPSLLPRCRGANPVFWAIASGETETGGTVHVLTPELDAGPVAARVAVEIAASDHYHDLYARLESIVPELVDRFVGFVRDGGDPEPQDPDDATTFRNDRMIHHRLFWSERSAGELERLVRAADGSAFFFVGGTRVRVLGARAEATNRNMTNDVRVPPGTVVDLEDGPVVATRDGFLVLEEIAAPIGRRPRFEVGQVLP